jgi:type IV pilus assembly protein PilE
MLKGKGVTLMELIIVIAIVSIISVVAIQAYSSYVKKGRRSDAINTLLSISLAEERYRSNNTQYGTLAQVWGGVTTSPSGYYTVSISNVSATSYTITATAIGNQTNDSAGGTSCSSLTLTMSSGTITKSPAACWSS